MNDFVISHTKKMELIAIKYMVEFYLLFLLF